MIDPEIHLYIYDVYSHNSVARQKGEKKSKLKTQENQVLKDEIRLSKMHERECHYHRRELFEGNHVGVYRLTPPKSNGQEYVGG